MSKYLNLQKQMIRERSKNEARNARQQSVESATSIAFVTMAESGAIDDVTATEHTELFSPWVVGVAYKVGELRRHNDVLYRCVQAHTSQEDWSPDVTPALWAKTGDPAEEYPEWSQPIGAHDCYTSGDKVSHKDQQWISTVDGNVWEPGIYGWEVVQ